MILIGTISVSMSAAKNNTDTAAPFDIPRDCDIWLQSDTGGVQFAFGAADDFAATSSSAFIPADSIPIGPFQTKGVGINIGLELGNCVPGGATDAFQGGDSQTAPDKSTAILSIYNPTSGTANVHVYAK